jgi:hypothetical protein
MTPVFLVDPKPVKVPSMHNVEYIKEGAGKGVAILLRKFADFA